MPGEFGDNIWPVRGGMRMTEPTPGPWAASSGNWDIGLLEPLAEISERVLEALAAADHVPMPEKGGWGLSRHSR